MTTGVEGVVEVPAKALDPTTKELPYDVVCGYYHGSPKELIRTITAALNSEAKEIPADKFAFPIATVDGERVEFRQPIKVVVKLEQGCKCRPTLATIEVQADVPLAPYLGE